MTAAPEVGLLSFRLVARLISSRRIVQTRRRLCVHGHMLPVTGSKKRGKPPSIGCKGLARSSSCLSAPPPDESADKPTRPSPRRVGGVYGLRSVPTAETALFKVQHKAIAAGSASVAPVLPPPARAGPVCRHALEAHSGRRPRLGTLLQGRGPTATRLAAARPKFSAGDCSAEFLGRRIPLPRNRSLPTSSRAAHPILDKQHALQT